MVKADPDVPDALRQVLTKLCQTRTAGGLEHLDRALRCQHGAVALSVQGEFEQTPMQGVQVKQQAVTQCQVGV